MKVFIVDDDREVLDAMSLMLEAFGHDVTASEPGPDPVGQVAAAMPECLIVDLVMPGADGFSLIEAARATPALAGLKIIAISGRAARESEGVAIEAGADAFVEKSYALYTLSDTVEALCMGRPVTGVDRTPEADLRR